MDGNPEKNTIAIGDTANNTKMTKRWAGEGNDTIPIGLKTFEKGGLVIENVETKTEYHQLVFSCSISFKAAQACRSFEYTVSAKWASHY